MNNYDETKDIINGVFYKDVAGIINGFLYVNCVLCEREILHDISVDGINDTFYCNKCIHDPRIKKCHLCNKFFNYIRIHYPCPVCISGCIIYCGECFRSANNIDSETYDNIHINYYWTIFDRIYHDQHID